MNNLNLLFTGISAIFGMLAFLFSLYTFYKVTAPIGVIWNNNLTIATGEIGYYNDAINFINVLGTNSPIVLLNIRIVNSRNYPISMFDIDIVDENNNHFTYFKSCTIPYYSEIPKLLINSSPQIALNLPYSHYQTFEPGSFSHVDIAISLDDIKRYNSKKITACFRLTTRTLLGYKSNLTKNDTKLKYKLYTKTFNI